jgi:predicted transposase/invertase (TIGR01784 family)
MQNVVSYAEKKGMEKGREEERLELIQNGLSKGYSIETIADFTKLTTDEVKIIIVEQGWEIN